MTGRVRRHVVLALHGLAFAAIAYVFVESQAWRVKGGVHRLGVALHPSLDRELDGGLGPASTPEQRSDAAARLTASAMNATLVSDPRPMLFVAAGATLVSMAFVALPRRRAS